MALKSALNRLPPRSPAPSMGTRVNRPGPETGPPAEPENLLASGAVASATDVEPPEEEVEEVEEPVAEGGMEAAGATATDPLVAAGTKTRKPRGPNKPKVSLGGGEAVDLAALRAEARELEAKGKHLAAEYDAARTQLAQQYDPQMKSLRARYVEVQETLAAAAFSL